MDTFFIFFAILVVYLITGIHFTELLISVQGGKKSPEIKNMATVPDYLDFTWKDALDKIIRQKNSRKIILLVVSPHRTNDGHFRPGELKERLAGCCHVFGVYDSWFEKAFPRLPFRATEQPGIVLMDEAGVVIDKWHNREVTSGAVGRMVAERIRLHDEQKKKGEPSFYLEMAYRSFQSARQERMRHYLGMVKTRRNYFNPEELRYLAILEDRLRKMDSL